MNIYFNIFIVLLQPSEYRVSGWLRFTVLTPSRSRSYYSERVEGEVRIRQSEKK